jgi:hypothetical protein
MSHAWLRFHAVFGDIEEVAPAVFVRPGVKLDPVALHAARFPRHVATMTTALWLHGIFERPSPNWWLIGQHARIPAGCDVTNTIARSRWVEQGVETTDLQRVPIRLHEPVWAVLHCVRFRSLLGDPFVLKTLKRALESQRVTEPALFETAHRCKLTGPLEELLARAG